VVDGQPGKTGNSLEFSFTMTWSVTDPPGGIRLDDTKIEIWYAHLDQLCADQATSQRFPGVSMAFDVWLGWNVIYSSDRIQEAKDLALQLRDALVSMGVSVS